MKKRNIILIIISVVFALVIGLNAFINKDKDYYSNVANIVVGFFSSSNYDKSIVKKQDLAAVENVLSKFTHQNEVIDLSEYIIQKKEYFTTQHNTSGVYQKDGKCFIKYDDLDFDEPVDEMNYEMEPYKKVICENYYTVLYESMFFPNYELTKKNPKYDYHFEDEIETDLGRDFIYYSSYDGSRLKISMILEKKTIKKINLEFLNAR